MSTPSNNSARSGNFDFPPASRPSTGASRETRTRHLLHQRIHEFNSFRAQHGSLTPNETHRQPRRASFQDRTHAFHPAIARHARQLGRRHRGAPVPDPPTSALMDRLHNATSEADSLLDQPIPRIGSPDISTREYSGEAEVNRQRKRRKIDHEERPLGVGMNGFRYGYRGSVAPGPLRMEIHSCDGGLHADALRAGRDYCPENVLRNDKSVYCTNDNRCNIVLRHREDVTFTLSKIVIKAPATGFTAPIQEGLVFISMCEDGLLSKTAPYTMRMPSPPPSTGSSRDDENQRPPSRRRDSTSRSIPPPISHLTGALPTNSGYSPYLGVYASESRALLASSALDTMMTTPPPQVPGFEITTHCDDPSSDEEEPSSAATLADRQRRDQAPPPYIDNDSDSEDVEEGIERALEARTLGISPRMLRGDLRNGRGRRRAEPSRIECRLFNTTDTKSQQQGEHIDGRRGSGDEQEQQLQDILAPHARFFIEKEKSIVTIRFEPAVSGKYILLKLWSPTRDQNIDIQSIIVHGFAGPRSFPGTTVL